MARTEVTGKQIKDQSVDLAVDVTGVLPVANGGTGSSSLTLNNVLLGNGTGALQSVSPGTAGNVLTSNGSTWVSAVPAAAQVTLNGSETLSNKTLTSPKIDYILDPNGAPAMWVGSQANAVNYAWIRNGAGETTGPQFRAAGPGTTIDVGVFSKGAGMISLGDGGSYSVAQFRPAASSPANYFVFQNTSAGGVPSLSVTGSDANVSINLISKGSGSVQANGVDVAVASRDFTNLASGSDFSNGTFGPWKSVSRWVLATDQAHSGTTSIKLPPGSGYASMFLGTYPTVHEFKPGDQVYMEFWAYADDAYVSDIDGKLRIGNQDNTLRYYLFAMTAQMTTRNTWLKFSTTYTVPAGDTGLIFSLQWNTTSGNLWIDDIVIRRVPAIESLPSTVITTTGSQTLTNKTISGSSNTLSNIPQSAVTSLTTDITGLLNRARAATQAGNNLLTNTAFTFSDFIQSYGTLSSEQSRLGTTSLKITGTGQLQYPSLVSDTTYQRINVRKGQKFYYEMWVYGHASNTITSGTSELISFGLWFYDKAGTYQASAREWTKGNGDTIGTGQWVLISGTLTVPDDDDITNMAPLLYVSTNLTAGNILYVDTVVLREVTEAVNINQALYGTNTTGTNILESSLPSTAVTTTAAQTLTNKTLTQPTLNNPLIVSSLKDANGATLLGTTATASAVNYLDVKNAASGGHPAFTASGSDANIHIDLVPKGSGFVRITGVPVVTETRGQTLTNKTISGASNTITNLPASATPQASRLVATTVGVAGANQWAKLMSYDTAGAFHAASLTLRVCAYGQAAIGQVTLQIGMTVQDAITPTMGVVSATGNRSYIRPENFKLIRSAIGTPVELWVKAPNMYCSMFVYEMSGSYITGKVTYHDGATWQVAEPVGANYNIVSTATPTVMGVPTVTTTDSQTLTNKTLTGPTIDNARTNNIRDLSGNSNISVDNPYSRLYLTPGGKAGIEILKNDNGVNFLLIQAASTGFPVYLAATGADANVGLNLATKGSGVVYVNNIPVVTTTASQTLTNKTLTTPTITTPQISLSSPSDITATVPTNQNLNIGGGVGGYPAYSPVSKYLWHDLLRFGRHGGFPTYETSADGTAWTSDSLNKNVFDGKESFCFTLADGSTTKGVRWTWQNNNFAFCGIEWWVIGFCYTNPGPVVTALVESSPDGTTWTTLHSSTVTSNASTAWLPSLSNGSHTRIRLTLVSTNGALIRLSSIKALSYRPGDQGSGAWLEQAYDWDADRNIYAPQNLKVLNPQNTTQSAVTVDASQTLTNKTLTTPIIESIHGTNNTKALHLHADVGAVNYFQISGKPTGNPVYVSARGGDTNINLYIQSKGTGFINLNNDAGTGLRINPVTSGVNYFQANSNVTGQAAELEAVGSDTNIGARLKSKGTGAVVLMSNSANSLVCYSDTSAQNYLQVNAKAAGSTPTLSAVGGDTNISLNLISKGTGTVQANGVPVVTTTDSQTLTNKTLTSPKMNQVLDANGAGSLLFTATTSGVNYTELRSGQSGGANQIRSIGSDTNINMMLVPKGSGGLQLYAGTTSPFQISVSSANTDQSINIATKGSGTVNANGVPVVTTTAAQTLTNKTISGSSNTLTNIPPEATPNASRRVALTPVGPADSNRWTKIMSFDCGTQLYNDGQALLAITPCESGANDSVIISVKFRTNGSGQNPNPSVAFLGAPEAGIKIGPQSFKIVNDGFGLPQELWMKKVGSYTQFAIYELSRAEDSDGAGWITYHSNYPWQSAEPTGTAINVTSDGVKVFGDKVVSETATQTLTNKTLTTPVINGLPTGTGVSSAATGNTLAARNSAGDTTFRYLHAEWVSNSHAVVTRNSDTAFYSTNDNYIRKNTATGFKTSLALNNVDNTSDATKNSAVATLTNKTLTSPTISTPTINGTTTISGDVTVDNGTSSLVVIRSDDTGTSGLLLRGQSQGTSYVEVTQDGSYGGGMSFFGGGGSTFATGESTDSVTFYRKGAGTRTAVFSYGWNSNNVNFAGNIAVAGNITSGGIAVPTISSSSTLTNKTISGSSNTLTNISISSLSNAPSLFNNMGEVHQQRTSFDAQGAASTVDFGWRYVQGSTNGPGTNSATQYYSQFIGLGSNYAYNTYGMQIAYPRNVTSPYISIRYQEGSVFGSWRKISAGYADSAGDADTLDGQHASAFVTPSGTATLTNKTITSPTFTGTAIGPINVMSNLINLDDWNSSPISIRERQGVANTNLDDKYSPNLNFHWASRVSNSLWMNTNGQLNWGGYSAAGVPAADGTINAGTFVGNLNGNATTASSASSITGGIPNNSNYEIRARVIRNSNSTTSNDGLYIGYGNTNGGLTRLYGGGDTTNPVTVSTGGQLTVSGNIFSGGVAVPTISSTHTLTNKTLTSPTISDPVINGNATGTAISTANTANTLVKRDGNGDFYIRYVFSSYLNMSHGVSGTTNDTIFYSSKDNYIRKNNASGFKSSLGLNNVDNTSDATKNSATATLTNKRITPRIGSVTSTATPSINTDIYDQYNITALATNITSVTVTGTPTDGQKLMLRIKGTATRTIAWGSSFISSGVALLPTTTSGTYTHMIGLIYDSAKAKWVCVAADWTGY